MSKVYITKMMEPIYLANSSLLSWYFMPFQAYRLVPKSKIQKHHTKKRIRHGKMKRL